MSDIYDALARGFRYPGRPDGYDDAEYDDPYDDYGTPGPRSPLPLEPVQTLGLSRAIHAALQECGCDNTLRAAQAWARHENVRWGWLRNELENRGGFCDCEVVMNILEGPD